MNVYVGTDTMKNAYIGEVFEYSYDFRGKTTSQVTAAGFTTKEGSFTINSNGVTSTSSSSRVLLHKTIPSLSNANRIILTQIVVLNSGAYGCSLRTMNSNRQYGTGNQLDVYSNSYGYLAGGDVLTTISGLSVGTYTSTSIIDLVNKTATFKLTGKQDYTASLTDTQVNNIKNNSTVIEVQSGNNPGTISSISIVVEY